MENNASAQKQSIAASAQQVRLEAESAAESMALSALTHCDRHFNKSMTEGGSLWVSEKCDPGAMATLGQTSAALVKTGRKQALVEMLAYLVICCGFGGTGLWMIAAPIWAYAFGVPVSGAFALGLAMTGNDKD